MQASVDEAARKLNEVAGATVDNAVTQLDRSATAAVAQMTAEFAPIAAEHWGCTTLATTSHDMCKPGPNITKNIIEIIFWIEAD